MNEIRILLIDDDRDQALKIRKNIEEGWLAVCPTRANVQVFQDVVDSKAATKRDWMEISYSEVEDFDVVVTDLFWARGRDGLAFHGGATYGINLCSKLRARYPSLPIVLISSKAQVGDFPQLFRVGVSAFICKESEDEIWCQDIFGALERAQYSGGGRPLYEKLREMEFTTAAWEYGSVTQAANAVWKQSTANEKWNKFWATMSGVGKHKALKGILDVLKTHFQSTDLITLGASPSMRGHFEHVLYVYFTGYFLSHRLPDFQKNVLTVGRRLLKAHGCAISDAEIWELFQMSWLCAATLHDTGYALEVLPDMDRLIGKIENTYSFVECSKLTEVKSRMIRWSSAKAAMEGYRRTLRALHTVWPEEWIEDNASFNTGDSQRINHGVASGALLVEQAQAWHGILKDSAAFAFLEWAATAMALHSLKIPGAKYDKKLKATEDPLSFLLMICDEIQLWDRERPDNAERTNRFRSVGLSALEIRGERIEVGICITPFRNSKSQSEVGEEMHQAILEDNRLLSKYIECAPWAMTIDFEVLGLDRKLPNLVLQ